MSLPVFTFNANTPIVYHFSDCELSEVFFDVSVCWQYFCCDTITCWCKHAVISERCSCWRGVSCPQGGGDTLRCLEWVETSDRPSRITTDRFSLGSVLTNHRLSRVLSNVHNYLPLCLCLSKHTTKNKLTDDLCLFLRLSSREKTLNFDLCC